MIFKIADRLVGKNQPIFFIAEAGVNHNGSLEKAKKLVNTAKECGADAIKFQSFITDEIILPNAPKSTYHIETTGKDTKQSWTELLKTQEMSKKMHENLIDYCKSKKIIFLSTPYEEKSADLLDSFNMPAFKIASTDNNNIKLLKHVAVKGKPIILSTAMSSEEEVIKSMNFLFKVGATEIVLMQCTGSYPSDLKDSNLNVIKKYKEIFKDKCLFGYSDHTESFINPVAASAIGISMYEKHFTLDKKLEGPDPRMSLNPEELQKTIKLIRQTETSLGVFKKQVLSCEVENRNKLKKSLVAKENISKGTKLTYDLITSKRPGNGISPSDIDKIVGQVSSVDIKKNTLLKKDMFNNHE